MLEVTREMYDFVAAKLKEAGYDHLFMDGDDHGIDMTGIAIVPGGREEAAPEEKQTCGCAPEGDGTTDRCPRADGTLLCEDPKPQGKTDGG